MAKIILNAFIVSGFVFLALGMMMAHEVSKRGVKVNFRLIRCNLIKYMNQYRRLTHQETGRVGSLYYPAVLFAVLTLVLLAVYLIFFNQDPPHSYRSESTGFARAALTEWKETVPRAERETKKPERRKADKPSVVRKAKFPSQRLMRT